MRSSTPESESNNEPAKLLVVSSHLYEQDVRWLLNAQAHVDWSSGPHIRTLFRPDRLRRFATENAREISRIAPQDAGTRILIVGKVEIKEKFDSPEETRCINVYPDLASFEKALPSIMRQSSSDWKTYIINRIAGWNHSTVDANHVELWLDQFRRFGVTWIGEYLLRSLDFWSAEKIRNALGLNRESLKVLAAVCLKRGIPGKSGDFMSNLVRKQIATFNSNVEMEDLAECLERQVLGPLLFIEDTLLTGTEMTNYLSGLLGLPTKPNRPWSVNRLTDPQLLRSAEIEFRFPIGTSLGKLRLMKFLEENAFERATVAVSDAGFNEVLTASGEQALTDGTFFEQGISNCPRDPDSHIDRPALMGPWRLIKKKTAAQDFCEHVGTQLFTQYLQRRGHTWPAMKIQRCALGMCGLGLAMASCHSVPKASLPVFWMDGKVTHDNSTLEWVPLFENGAF